jgi:hypothetical protein
VDPQPNLRTRLSRAYAAGLLDDVRLIDAWRRVRPGLIVLGEAVCRDRCQQGWLVQDADGFWPILLDTTATPLLDGTEGPGGIADALTRGTGPLPTVLDALAAILPSETEIGATEEDFLDAVGRPDEWLAGFLAVAFVDSGSRLASVVRTTLMLGSPRLTTGLERQRTVIGNLSGEAELRQAFQTALDERGMTLPVGQVMQEADRTEWIGQMWLADRDRWPARAHQFLDHRDRRAATGTPRWT